MNAMCDQPGVVGTVTAHRRVMLGVLVRLAGTAASVAAAAAPALAAPEGGRVVAGEATIRTRGDVTTIRAGNNSVINFRSFNVRSGQTVRFIQPGADARVLNRVTGPGASRIDGSLLANGRVYIMNPSGVIIGPDAVVNVGSLIAGAGKMSTADFINGTFRVTDMAGSVVNHGSISAGETVALVGKQVANTGIIDVPQGAVVMAAGDKVLMGERGGRMYVQVDAPAQPGGTPQTGVAVDQAGTIKAARSDVMLAAGDMYGLAIRHSGQTRARSVKMDGGTGVIVSGTVDVSNPAGVGGRVEVLGKNVAVVDGTINASGSTGGGVINVGGAFQGGDVRRSETSFVSEGSTLRADATRTGAGGEVVVWSDGVTGVYGSLSAAGATGKGGMIETSGRRALDVNLESIDLASRSNAGAGTWLLDPADITISNSSSSGFDVDPVTGLYTPGFANSGTIDALDISTALNGNNNVVIFTSEPGLSGALGGRITVSNPISTSGTGSLALIANSDLVVNAGITLNGGDLLLNAGSGGGFTVFGVAVPADAFNSTGQINVGGNIITGGGDVILRSGSAGAVSIGSPISTSGGTLAIDVGSIGVDQSSAFNVGNLVIRSGGFINLTNATNSVAGNAALVCTDPTPSNLQFTAAGTLNVGSVGNTNIGGVQVTGANGITLATNQNLQLSAGTLVLPGISATGSLSLTGATTLNGTYDATAFTVTGATTLGSGTTVNAGSGNITLTSTLAGGGNNLTLNSTGATRIQGAITNVGTLATNAGGTTRLDSTVATTTSLNFADNVSLFGGSYATTGSQTYGGTLTLDATAPATVTINSGSGGLGITGTVTGNTRSLTLQANSGTLQIGGAVSGLSVFEASSSAAGAGAIAVNSVSSSGSQTFTGNTTLNGATYSPGAAFTVTGNLTLGTGVSITPTNANVSITGTTAGGNNALTINAGTGTVTLGGAASNLSTVQLTSTNGGTNAISVVGVGSSGTQTYTGNTTLSGNYNATALTVTGGTTLAGTTTINTGSGNITLQSTLAGAGNNFTLNTSGASRIQGAISNVGELTTNPGGTTRLDSTVSTTAALLLDDNVTLVAGGAYTTTGAQRYGTLTLDAAASSPVSFTSNSFQSGAITGNNKAVTINSGAGTALISGPVSGLTSLSIQSTNAGAGAITVNNVTTTGGQTYTGNTTLNGTTYGSGGAFAITGNASLGDDVTITSTGFNTSISGTVSGAGNDLTVAAGSGTITLGGTAAGLGTLSLSSTNAGAGAIAVNSVASSGAQTYTGNATFNGATYTTSAGGNLGVTGTLTLGTDVAITTTGFNTSVSGQVLGAGNDLVVNTGSGRVSITGTSAGLGLLNLTSTNSMADAIAVGDVVSSGSQTYNGNTTFNGTTYGAGGALQVNGAASIASGATLTAGPIGITGAVTLGGGTITFNSSGFAGANRNQTFGSTINGPAALVLNAGGGSGGDILVSGFMGGSTPLTSLVANGQNVTLNGLSATGGGTAGAAGGGLVLLAGNYNTGSLDFLAQGSTIRLTGDSTVSTTGNATFDAANPIEGQGNAFAIVNANQVSFTNSVTGVRGFLVSSFGNVNISGSVSGNGGGAFSLTSNATKTVTGGVSGFTSLALAGDGNNTISGAISNISGALTAVGNGTTTLSTFGGSITNVGSIDVDTLVSFGGALVSTNGAQVWRRAFTATGAGARTFTVATGNLEFLSTLAGGGGDLALNSSGVTRLGGDVSAFAAVTTSAGGSTELGVNTDVTVGSLAVGDDLSILGSGASTNTIDTSAGNGAFSVAGNTTITGTGARTVSTGSGNATFTGTLAGGGNDLTVNSTGTTAFMGTVSGIGALATNAGGSTQLGSGANITANSIAIGDSLTLMGSGASTNTIDTSAANGAFSVAGATTITGTGARTVSTGSGNATFTGAVTGAGNDLAVNSSGVTTFGGDVSGIGALTTDAGGASILGGNVSAGSMGIADAATLRGGTYSTTGQQTYAAVTLDAAAPATVAMNGVGVSTGGITGNGRSLAINAGAGRAVVNGAAAGLNALSVTSTNTGADAIDVQNVATAAAQTYTGNATLRGTTYTSGAGFGVSGSTTLAGAGARTISAGADGATFSGTLAGGSNSLAVNTTGTTSFLGDVTGVNALTTDAGGTTQLGANVDITAGSVAIGDNLAVAGSGASTNTIDTSAANGAVSVAGTTTFTGGGARTVSTGSGNATFTGAVTGAGNNLTVNSTGTTAFGGDLSGLGALTTNAGGSTQLGTDVDVTAASVTIGDDLTIAGSGASTNTIDTSGSNGAFSVAGTTTFTGTGARTISTGSGNATFTGSVTGANNDLAINSTGATTFSGDVTGLGALSTNAGGTTQLGTGVDVTASSVAIGDDLTIAGTGASTNTIDTSAANGAFIVAGTTTFTGTGTRTVSTGSGNATFTGAVAGAGNNLTINSTGATAFGGDLSGLGALTTNAGGSTQLGANVDIAATRVTINDALNILGSGTTANTVSTGTGDVTFAGTVTGAGNDLTVNSTGTTAFMGDVSGLGAVTTDAGGMTEIGSGTDLSAGSLAINDDLTFTGADASRIFTTGTQFYGGRVLAQNNTRQVTFASDAQSTERSPIYRFRRGIGSTASPLGSVAFDSGPQTRVTPNGRIRFATVLLSSDATSGSLGSPNTQTDFRIDARNGFTMSPNDAIVSFGNLTIDAGTSSAVLGSLAALGSINVNAGEITLLNGAEITSSNQIRFNTASPLRTGTNPGERARIGIRPSNNAGLVTPNVQAGGFPLLVRDAELAAGEFLDTSLVTIVTQPDAGVAGAVNTVTASAAITAAVSDQEATRLFTPRVVTQLAEDFLSQLGARSRRQTISDLAEALIGRGLYQDIPIRTPASLRDAANYPITLKRFDAASLTSARDAVTTLGKHPHLAALSTSWDTYRADGGADFAAFRAGLNADEASALAAMERVVESFRRLGLTQAETRVLAYALPGRYGFDAGLMAGLLGEPIEPVAPAEDPAADPAAPAAPVDPAAAS